LEMVAQVLCSYSVERNGKVKHELLLERYNSCAMTGLDRSLGMEEVEVPRISRQSAHKVDKIVSPMHRPSLHPQEISLLLISIRC